MYNRGAQWCAVMYSPGARPRLGLVPTWGPRARVENAGLYLNIDYVYIYDYYDTDDRTSGTGTAIVYVYSVK